MFIFSRSPKARMLENLHNCTVKNRNARKKEIHFFPQLKRTNRSIIHLLFDVILAAATDRITFCGNTDLWAFVSRNSEKTKCELISFASVICGSQPEQKRKFSNVSGEGVAQWEASVCSAAFLHVCVYVTLKHTRFIWSPKCSYWIGSASFLFE